MSGRGALSWAGIGVLTRCPPPEFSLSWPQAESRQNTPHATGSHPALHSTTFCHVHQPDLIISAGFMKLVGATFLARFGGRYLNTHPALLPAFPGMHAARDALEHGVKITGCTLFVVDEGIDSGPSLAQRAVTHQPDDDETSLHDRIKTQERQMLIDTIHDLVRHGIQWRDRTAAQPESST